MKTRTLAVLSFVLTIAVAVAYAQSPRRTQTVASNGGGTAATASISLNGPSIEVECQDPDSCALTVAALGGPPRDHIVVVTCKNTATGSGKLCTFANQNDYVTVGSGGVSLDNGDSVTFMYTDRKQWIRIAQADNLPSTPTPTNTPVPTATPTP